jgi:S-adenosylmethionine/arginine decarboxylase-like enzyme
MAVASSLCSSQQTTKSWGYHLLLDCKSCDKERITNPETLKEFVKVLIETIDMKAYGEPILKHFAEHNPEVAGYSLLQFIETSSITGHFCDRSGDCYIDIFSCKSFDTEKAKSCVSSFLLPENVKMIFLQREA